MTVSHNNSDKVYCFELNFEYIELIDIEKIEKIYGFFDNWALCEYSPLESKKCPVSNKEVIKCSSFRWEDFIYE